MAGGSRSKGTDAGGSIVPDALHPNSGGKDSATSPTSSSPSLPKQEMTVQVDQHASATDSSRAVSHAVTMKSQRIKDVEEGLVRPGDLGIPLVFGRPILASPTEVKQ